MGGGITFPKKSHHDQDSHLIDKLDIDLSEVAMVKVEVEPEQQVGHYISQW